MRNKPTVVRFLAICAAAFFVLTMLGTTVMITYTTHQAVSDTARRTLTRANWHIRDHLQVQGGELVLAAEKSPIIQECFFAVMTEEGEILLGDAPEEMAEAFRRPIQTEKKNRFEGAGSGRYATYDHRVRMVHQEKGEAQVPVEETGLPELYIRTAIDVKQMDSIYRSIQHAYYLFVLVLLLVLGIGGLWFYRRAARPVRQMCDSVERIMENADFSERIGNTGPFYETEIMTDAYNRLIDRTQRLALQQEEFNENVSHELRTPVALIRSECELVEDLYLEGIPAEAAEAIEVIHRQSDRMNTMIAELLYLSRINRETYELQRETVDLVDLAASACEDAEDLMNGRWAFSYDLQPAQAKIDVALVMIAIRNLISNAMKYSPQGTRIEIATGVEEDFAFLRVRDEGIGIAEENLEKIFEPYYQVKGERNSDGFGLGLSLVQKVAEKHWGCICVESGLGEGSTFTLRLPISDQPWEEEMTR